jgi:hypothetical protein
LVINGCEPEVVLPDSPPGLRAFCTFSGLRNQLFGEPEPDISDPRCVTVPLRRHSKSHYQDAEPIQRLIRAQASASTSEDRLDQLGIIVSELMQNVEDHAASTAISCARFFSKKNEVRVAIVDLGRGIASTLRKKYVDFSDEMALRAVVLEGGYSAQSRRNNLGQGLSNLGNAVQGAGGMLTVMSETALLELRPGHKARTSQIQFRFPGTAIFFTLPTVKR